MTKKTWKTNLLIAAMLLPSLILALGIILTPMISVVIQSLQDSNGNFSFEQYQFLFTDKMALQNLWYTVWITVITVVAAIFISYLLALYLRFSDTKISKFIGVMYLLPRFVPQLVAIYAMMTVVRDSGLLNRVSQVFGYNFKPGLLYNAKGIIMMNLWFNIAFATMIIVAALAGIPDSIVESSRMWEPAESTPSLK